MKIFTLIILIIFSLEGSSQSESQMIPYRVGNLWGFSNVEGEILIKAEYDSIRFFSGPFAVAKTAEGFGYIDQKGKRISKFKYEHAEDFNVLNNVGSVKHKGKKKYINSKGKEIVKNEFRGIGGCGGLRSKVNLSYEIFFYKKNEKFGFIEYTCNRYVDSCKIFHDPIFTEFIGFGNYMAGVTLDKKWAIVDMKRIFLSDYIYDEIIVDKSNPHKNGGLTIVKKNKKHGYLNDKGELTIAIKYDKVNFFKNGLAVVEEKGKWGYINKNGLEYFEN